MKIRRLWIDRFKNLLNCEVAFEQPHLLTRRLPAFAWWLRPFRPARSYN